MRGLELRGIPFTTRLASPCSGRGLGHFEMAGLDPFPLVGAPSVPRAGVYGCVALSLHLLKRMFERALGLHRS